MGCFISGDKYRWPNGIIPYEIDEEDFPTGESFRQSIEEAIDHWNTTNTPIRLEARSDDEDYVRFETGSACSSLVGRRGTGKQIIHCDLSQAATNQRRRGIIIHEIGHAVGMWHEQGREDRDSYVTIIRDNIVNGHHHNFDKQIDDGDDIESYNYGSVMHYGRRSFAIEWTLNRSIYDQKSKAVPSVTEFNGELHMVHLGDSSNNIWHSRSTDGRNWTDNEKIEGQKSKASPALAVFNGELHMVHLGDSSNNIWHSWSTDGRNWTDNEKIEGQKSKASPALAVFNGELHMVHLGDSSNNIWHSWSTDGRNWTDNEKIEGQKSKAPSALAVFNGELHMVHLGDSSNNIWHSWSTDGRIWTDNEKIEGQKSRASPSLSAFSGRLHIVHLGNSSNNIWHSRFDGAEWSLNKLNSNQTSKVQPVIATFGSELHLLHLGKSSNNIWHSQYDPTLRTIDAPQAIGQRNGLNQGDIAAINSIYGTLTGIGTAKALSVLQNILSDETNLGKLRETLQTKFDSDPELFFRTYVFRWEPQTINLNHSGKIKLHQLSARDKRAAGESPKKE